MGNPQPRAAAGGMRASRFSADMRGGAAASSARARAASSAICYQLRGRKRQIISFRKANKREERIYAKAIINR